MSEVVGHGRCGSCGGLTGENLLLLVVADSDGGEVCEALQDTEVLKIEQGAGGMRDDPEGAAGLPDFPGNEDPIGDRGRVDADAVKIRFRYGTDLRSLAQETCTAGAEVVGLSDAEEGRIGTGGGDPAELSLAVRGDLFERDTGAVGTTELHGDGDKFLKNVLRIGGKDVGEAVQGFDLAREIALTVTALCEGDVVLKIQEKEAT